MLLKLTANQDGEIIFPSDVTDLFPNIYGRIVDGSIEIGGVCPSDFLATFTRVVLIADKIFYMTDNIDRDSIMSGGKLLLGRNITRQDVIDVFSCEAFNYLTNLNAEMQTPADRKFYPITQGYLLALSAGQGALCDLFARLKYSLTYVDIYGGTSSEYYSCPEQAAEDMEEYSSEAKALLSWLPENGVEFITTFIDVANEFPEIEANGNFTIRNYTKAGMDEIVVGGGKIVFRIVSFGKVLYPEETDLGQAYNDFIGRRIVDDDSSACAETLVSFLDSVPNDVASNIEYIFSPILSRLGFVRINTGVMTFRYSPEDSDPVPYMAVAKWFNALKQRFGLTGIALGNIRYSNGMLSPVYQREYSSDTIALAEAIMRDPNNLPFEITGLKNIYARVPKEVLASLTLFERKDYVRGFTFDNGEITVFSRGGNDVDLPFIMGQEILYARDDFTHAKVTYIDSSFNTRVMDLARIINQFTPLFRFFLSMGIDVSDGESYTDGDTLRFSNNADVWDGSLTLAASSGVKYIDVAGTRLLSTQEDQIGAYYAGAVFTRMDILHPDVVFKCEGIFVGDTGDSLLASGLQGTDWRNEILINGYSIYDEENIVKLLASDDEITPVSKGGYPIRKSDIMLIKSFFDTVRDVYREHAIPVNAIGLSRDNMGRYKSVVDWLFIDDSVYRSKILPYAETFFTGGEINISLMYPSNDGVYRRNITMSLSGITAEDAIASGGRAEIGIGENGPYLIRLVSDENDTVSFDTVTEDQTYIVCANDGYGFKVDVITSVYLDEGETCSGFETIPPPPPTSNGYPRVVYTISTQEDGTITVTYQALDENNNDITDQIRTFTVGDHFFVIGE